MSGKEKQIQMSCVEAPFQKRQCDYNKRVNNTLCCFDFVIRFSRSGGFICSDAFLRWKIQFENAKHF